jgi:hypothetical protein
MGLAFVSLIMIEEIAIWRRKFFAWFDGRNGLSHADRVFSVKTAVAALYKPQEERPTRSEVVQWESRIPLKR